MYCRQCNSGNSRKLNTRKNEKTQRLSSFFITFLKITRVTCNISHFTFLISRSFGTVHMYVYTHMTCTTCVHVYTYTTFYLRFPVFFFFIFFSLFLFSFSYCFLVFFLATGRGPPCLRIMILGSGNVFKSFCSASWSNFTSLLHCSTML